MGYSYKYCATFIRDNSLQYMNTYKHTNIRKRVTNHTVRCLLTCFWGHRKEGDVSWVGSSSTWKTTEKLNESMLRSCVAAWWMSLSRCLQVPTTTLWISIYAYYRHIHFRNGIIYERKRSTNTYGRYIDNRYTCTINKYKEPLITHIHKYIHITHIHLRIKEYCSALQVLTIIS